MPVSSALLLLALPQGALALDLGEARRVAAERSLAVERARADADAAAGDAGVVLAGSLPSVVGFADASTGAGLTAFGFPRPIQNQLGVGLTASWTLVDPGGWAAASAARRTARGQSAMVDWAMVDARRAATSTYAAALAASEEVAALRVAWEDAREAADAVASLAEAGLRPPADAAQARAAAAVLHSRLLEAEGRAGARCAELQGLIRAEVNGRCALDPVQWAPALEGPAEHPALVAAREALGAAEATRTAAVLDRAPTVSASATGAQYAVTGGESGPGWSASVGVDVPIVAGGAGAREIQADRARVRAAEAALDDQRQALDVARVSAELRLQAARAGLEAREEALTAAQAALELVDERYANELEDITAWLAARQARDNAAVALAQAQAELGAALAEVEAARGVW
ncbi:MAG: TolC family protein [Alphaproteobacteria bacterium]|nr:TolC family protein [Alphaproteobacteria bacterium]